MNSKAAIVIQVILFVVMAFYGVAFMVFQWRNPKANTMTFYREPGAVIRFAKLDKYQ